MKAKFFLLPLIYIMIISLNTYSQEKTEPIPIGGISAIQKNINYPAEAKANNIQGKVIIKATVNEQGKVTSTEIMNEEKLGYGIESAAQTAVQKTKFTPAMKNNKPVKSEVVIPILFKLK